MTHDSTKKVWSRAVLIAVKLAGLSKSERQIGFGKVSEFARRLRYRRQQRCMAFKMACESWYPFCRSGGFKNCFHYKH